MKPAYRALVCVTTCQRPQLLRRYLPHFARFCCQDDRFSLLVALDGDDPATRDFCDSWEIPLLYSDAREGVGLSKNRVLERFPEFDYYFFVEDDVELVDGAVFPAHVELAQATGIHHFSLFERNGVRGQSAQSVVGGRTVVHGLFGSADFNFFTRAGLTRVGGWHTRFARYRRWGHTEHSYRFSHAGLAPAPFNVAQWLADTCIWHSPPAVTPPQDIAVDDDQIAAPERELLDHGLVAFPLQTLCPHHTNGVDLESRPERLAATLAASERYPLVGRSERRQCRSDYRLWQSRTADRLVPRALRLLGAVCNWPTNPALRHAVRVRLAR